MLGRGWGLESGTYQKCTNVPSLAKGFKKSEHMARKACQP